MNKYNLPRYSNHYNIYIMYYSTSVFIKGAITGGEPKSIIFKEFNKALIFVLTNNK